MELTIINHTGWKKVYLKLLNHQRKSTYLLLNFNEKSATVDINLDKFKYAYLTDKKHQTDIIILHENLSIIELNYVRKIKAYTASLRVKGEDDYGYIETYLLQDEKNLSYRKKAEKKIHVLLPKNYQKDKKYGLIIMFDGQNLFDQNKINHYTNRNDPYGSWQIETSLSQLNKLYPEEEYLVVGIENADKYRELELSMGSAFGDFPEGISENEFTKIGYLDMLDDFINETLLPFIFNKYSINQNNIGISGASCGGTACHYVGLKNHQKYQFILCFTPASGFYCDESWKAFYQKLNLKKQTNLPFFYYFQGKHGWLERLLTKLNSNLVNNLLENGYPNQLIHTYIEPKANHNELAWRYGFAYGILERKKRH